MGAVERMVGVVEDTGRAHGIEHPIQMTIATTDGRSVWAFRYSSEGDSRSLYYSTRMDALKAVYPDIEAFAGLSDQTRVVVSSLSATFPVPGQGAQIPRRDRPTRRRRATTVRPRR